MASYTRNKLDFDVLFDKAAKKHGHKCPSLYYGVKGVITALNLADERNVTVKQATIQGKSKCIRDGATTVLAAVSLNPVLAEDGCGISLGDGAQNLQLTVKPRVREKINSLNKQLPVEQFQQEGLKYLRALSDEELFEVL